MGYLKFCGFADKIPVGIPQVLWLRSQDPGWDSSSLWLPEVCGFAVRNPVGIPQVCGFVVRIPVGIPQVLWNRIPEELWVGGQDPGWDSSMWLWLGGQAPGRDTSSSSWSGSRLGYLKFCDFVPQVSGFAVKIPVGIPQVCGFAVKIPVGIPQFCGLVVRVQVGIPEVLTVASWSRSRLEVLWLRGQDPGWSTNHDPG